MTDNPNPQIFDTARQSIGQMKFEPDAKSGRQNASLLIKDKTLRKNDVKAVLYQAFQHTHRQGSREAINIIEFDNCVFLQERNTDQAEAFFQELGVSKPELAVNEIRFIGGSNAAPLFRAFVSLVEAGSFDIESTSWNNCSRAFKTLDLSGLKLGRLEVSALPRLASLGLALLCIKLKDCSLTDSDVPYLLLMVDSGTICQLFLEGNNISQPNLAEIAGAIHNNSLARLKKVKNYMANRPVHDFNLPPLTKKVQYLEGKFVDIPIRGTALDLSNVDLSGVGDDDPDRNKYLPDFQAELAACNPTKIIIHDRADLHKNLLYTIGPAGLFYSDSVLEIDISYSQPQAGLTCFADTFEKMVTTIFPNTRKLVLDNNRLAGTQVLKEYYSSGNFGSIAAAPMLETLSLRGCHLQDKDISYKSKKSYLPKTHMTAQAAGKNLTTLDLAHNALTNKCAPALLEWVKNSGITSIRLEGTQISAKNKTAICKAATANGTFKAAQAAQGSVREHAMNVNVTRAKILERKGMITITSGGQPLNHGGKQ